MMPNESPRVRGIREHLQRAQFFIDLARQQKDAKSSYRLKLAAVYSCRAIANLMLEAAEKQEVRGFNDSDPQKNRKALVDQISRKLPFYTLLEYVRIHDFHRFGILPPDPALKQVMLGGPLKLTAQKGLATVSMTAQGIKVQTTGGSQVKQQRPLLNQDGAFFDEQSSEYVSLDKALQAFLREAPDVISEFEKLMA